MALSVGDRIPDVTLMRMTGEGPAPVGTGESLGSGLVAVPAQSPHLLRPSPARLRPASRRVAAKGSTRSPASRSTTCSCSTSGATRLGRATRSLCPVTATASSPRPRGLELDGSAFGLGTRSQRCTAILEDVVVRQLMVEPDPLAVTVSSVDTVPDAL